MELAKLLRAAPPAVGMLVVGIICLTTPAIGQTDPVSAQTDPRDRLQVDAFSPVQLELPTDASDAIVTPVTLEGVEYLMALDLHSLRSADFRVLVPGADGTLREVSVSAPQTYRGALAERPDSRVAATLKNGQLTAAIICDDGAWGLQPLTDLQGGADRTMHAVYRLEDVRPVEGMCGADMLEPPADAALLDDAGDDGGDYSTRGEGCDEICEIAFDADYEFYELNDSSVADTVADIESVLNTMEVIYDRDVDIVYELTTVIVRDTEPDPYTSSDPSTLLDQFRSEWNNNQGDVVRDVAHLMTGRDLNGGVIGIAWLGVICSTNRGYGLSQSRFTGNFTSRVGLTAHEVGHNWSAGHCDGDGDCYIMCSGLGGCAHDLTRFGSRSIGDIVPYRNTRGCLTESGPVFLTQPTPSQTVCEDEPFVSLSVEVSTLLPEYQWRRGTTELVDDGVRIFGATTATLLIGNITEADEASDYNCVVTEAATGCAAASDDAEIIVDSVPVVTAQPQDQTTTEGNPVSFSVTVEDGLFMAYQWRKDGASLSDDGRFFGTGTAALSIIPAELGDAGAYDCVVTALLGGQCSVISDAATLTVIPAGNDCPADLDGDGDIDLSDLSVLLANYGLTGGADPEDGDLDGDGDVDLADLSALLAVYGTNCP